MKLTLIRSFIIGYLFALSLSCLPVSAQPLDHYNYHGSVQSVTIEKVALSNKLRNWFSGPEVQALLVTEQNHESVQQETVTGTLYERVFVKLNDSGKIRSIRREYGDQTLKSKTTIDYATGLLVRKQIQGELNGLYPDVQKIYDENRQLIEENIYSKNGELHHSYQYSYPSPKQVKRVEFDHQGQAVEYSIDIIDEQDRLIDTSRYQMDDELKVQHTYAFDELGNMFEERILNKDEQTTGLFKYRYDSSGNCVFEQFITITGGAEMTKEYRYNANNDPIWYYSSGRKGGRLDCEEYRYKYDNQGNWITKITYEVRHDYYGRTVKSPVTAEYRSFQYQ